MHSMQFIDTSIDSCTFPETRDATDRMVINFAEKAKRPIDDMRNELRNQFDQATLDAMLRGFRARPELFAKQDDPTYRVMHNIEDIAAFMRDSTLNEALADAFLHRIRLSVSSSSQVFISYSFADSALAEKLFERLSQRGMNVWFAPRRMESGKEVGEQLGDALDKVSAVVAVITENSLRSSWVMREIGIASTSFQANGFPLIFSVRTVPYEQIQNAAVGALEKDFIPDFTDWQDNVTFERAFNGLAKDIETRLSGLDAGKR